MDKASVKFNSVLTTNIILLSLVTSSSELMMVGYLGLSKIVFFLQLCHIVLIGFEQQLRSNHHQRKELLLLHAWVRKNTVTYIYIISHGIYIYSCNWKCSLETHFNDALNWSFIKTSLWKLECESNSIKYTSASKKKLHKVLQQQWVG